MDMQKIAVQTSWHSSSIPKTEKGETMDLWVKAILIYGSIFTVAIIMVIFLAS